MRSGACLMSSCSWRSAWSACWRAACSSRILPFLLLAVLAGCGSLPRPFEGNPGTTARMLAQPPQARLFVDRPDAASLNPARAELFATALADALAGQDIPAISVDAHKGDWHIALQAKRQGASVLPMFVVSDEKDEQVGIAQGQPVPAAQWNEARVETLRGRWMPPPESAACSPASRRPGGQQTRIRSSIAKCGYSFHASPGHRETATTNSPDK